MQSEKESHAAAKKVPTLGLRFAGIFFGAVTGLVLSVILFFTLDNYGVISGYDRIFLKFAVWGAATGGVLGFVFPVHSSRSAPSWAFAYRDVS